MLRYVLPQMLTSIKRITVRNVFIHVSFELCKRLDATQLQQHKNNNEKERLNASSNPQYYIYSETEIE